MEYQVKLPITNENGCYEIRLESIGGLGANLCGKLLGELGASYLHLNVASFASYGSEKRGSPVKAFVRYSDETRQIRVNSPIKNPHILGLFHEAMASGMDAIAGVLSHTRVIVNTEKSPEETRAMLKLHAGTIGVIDALNIAMEEKTRINMIMLGAIVRASGFIGLEAAVDICKEVLGKKYPAMVEANVRGVHRGYQELNMKYFAPEEKYPQIAYEEQMNSWGYKNAPIGGVNPCYGSTVSNDLTPSREGYIPLLIKERCIHCGLCDTTCPDMVFQFCRGQYKGREMMVNQGLDYRHCKGCMRCVEVCPTNALVMAKEREHPNPDYQMDNQEMVKDVLCYEKTGPNAWVTSDSYFTEQRIDGGVL